MKQVIGALMVGGFLLGLYVGVWLCFVGGIVSIIHEVQSTLPADAAAVAWGIVRIMFAGGIGTICGAFLVIPGIALFNSDDAP